MRSGEHHERIEVESRSELRDWLRTNHRQSESVWLVRFKRPDPRYVSYDDLVEECLCWGWVDSLPRKLDELRVMTRISPRRAKSAWSGLNKRRVEEMEAARLMTAAGRRVVDAAKANGMWTFLDDVERLEVPPDLAEALDAAGGRKAWDAFPPSTKRGILERVKQAKRPETRRQRIDEVASKAARGERAFA